MINAYTLLALFIFLITVTNGISQNLTVESGVIDLDRGNDALEGSVLVPLYAMARGFLTNLVQFEDLRYMQEKGVNFSDWDSIIDHDYNDWISYFSGYIGWSAFGLLMLIAMVIGTFCFCCCSICCCCCCCSKDQSDNYEKPSSACKIGLSIALLILISAMLPPLSFMVFSAIRLRDQVHSDENVFDTIRSGITSLDNYAVKTVEQMETSIIGSVNELTGNVTNDFTDMQNQVIHDMNVETGVASALTNLTNFVNDFIESNNVTIEAENLAEILDDEEKDLDIELGNIATAIVNSIGNCTTLACLKARLNSTNLETNAKYSEVKNNLTALGTILDPLVSELETESQFAHDEYTDAINTVISDIDNITDTALVELDAALGEMEEYIDDVESKINEFDFENALSEVDKIEDDAYTPADLLFYAIVGVSCLICFVILLYFIGILLGFCCSSDENSTCNQKSASAVLKLGILTTFIIQAFLMVILIAVFLSSGIFYTEFCRHMVSYNESSVSDIMDEIIDGTILDGVDVTLSVSKVYTDCGSDRAFYTAFDLEKNALNITEVVYNPALDEAINNLQDYDSTQTFSVVLLSDDLYTLFGDITTLLGKLNFTEHYDELKKDVVDIDVENYIVELNSITDDVEHQDDFVEAISDLEYINTHTIMPMEVNKTELNNLLKELENLLGDEARVNSLQVELDAAEENINNEALTTEILQRNRDSAVVQLDESLETSRIDIIYNVETNIGQCFVVYHVIANVTDEMCVRTLYPIHGFWFSLGWCYVFMIVGVIVSLKLASEFRKLEKSNSTKNSPQDQVPMKATKVSYEPEQDSHFEGHSRQSQGVNDNLIHNINEIASFGPEPDYDNDMNDASIENYREPIARRETYADVEPIQIIPRAKHSSEPVDSYNEIPRIYPKINHGFDFDNPYDNPLSAPMMNTRPHSQPPIGGVKVLPSVV